MFTTIQPKSSLTVVKKKLLTTREREVLYLIAKEYTNKDISEALFISMNTVHSHRKNLLAKLQARNTAGVIVKSYENGILPMLQPTFQFDSTKEMVMSN